MVTGEGWRDPSVARGADLLEASEEALDFVYAVPVGVKGCGWTPTVKAFSFHKTPASFGKSVKDVLAILTTKEVVIYHGQFGAKIYWVDMLRHHWMDHVVVSATSLAWHPVRPELYVGDIEGRVTMFKYNEDITDRGKCSYKYDCIYQDWLRQKVCSLHWDATAGPIGECLLIAYSYCLILFQSHPRGLKKILIDLVQSPHNYVAKFHPKKPYLFIGADDDSQFRVFSNTKRATDVQPKWRQIKKSDCPGGIRFICLAKICARMLIVTAGRSPRLWHFMEHENGLTPEFSCIGTRSEDRATEKNLTSMAIVCNTLNQYIACGYGDGSISIYEVLREKRRASKLFNYSFEKIIEIPPDGSAPAYSAVTYMERHPNLSNMLMVSGNNGFIRQWAFVAKGVSCNRNVDIEYEKNYYITPNSQKVPDYGYTPVVDVESSRQLALLSERAPAINLKSNPTLAVPNQQCPPSAAPQKFANVPQLLLQEQTPLNSLDSEQLASQLDQQLQVQLESDPNKQLGALNLQTERLALSSTDDTLAAVIPSNTIEVPTKFTTPADSFILTEHTCKYYYNSTTHQIEFEKPEEMLHEQQQEQLRLLSLQHHQRTIALQQLGRPHQAHDESLPSVIEQLPQEERGHKRLD